MNTYTKKRIEEGNQLKGENKLAQAIEQYSLVLQVKPDCIQAHYQLAEIYESIKELDKAIYHYQNIIQKETDNSIAYAKLARVMTRQGDFQDAICTCSKVLAQKPKEPKWFYGWVYLLMGDALAQNQQIDEAIFYFRQSISIRPNNSSAYSKLAMAMIEQQNIQGAFEAYQKAISIKPEQPVSLYIEIGNALTKNGQEDIAISIYQKAIELSPDNSGIYQGLVHFYSQQGQLDNAIKKYLIALELKPESVFILNQLAEFYLYKKQLNNAIKKYLIALELKPESVFILNQLAEILKQLYFMTDREEFNFNYNLDELVKIYQKIIELHPHKAEAHFGMGHIFILQKRWNEAINYLLETLKNNPYWAQVYQSLAYALKQQGDHESKAISLCYESYIIPKNIINKIYNCKQDNLAIPLKQSSDLKYFIVEEREPFLPQKTEKNFVVILDDGLACRNSLKNPNNAVITSSNKIVKEVSGENYPLILYANSLKKTHVFDETVAYLLNTGLNYYHWMLQVIPQFCLLRRVGINLDEIDKFAFFRQKLFLSFQKETLRLLGIPESKVIETYQNPHIKAKRLIVTSTINCAPPRKLACDLVKSEILNRRDKFLNQKFIKTIDRPTHVYISRKNASYRRIINENQLINLLHNFGFRSFCLESLTFLEQVDLFSKAEVIIAPHGAGLTNLIFSQPNIKLLEIFAKSYHNICFETISSYYCFNYYSFIAEDVDNPTINHKGREKERRLDIHVNLNSLLDFMKLIEII